MGCSLINRTFDTLYPKQINYMFPPKRNEKIGYLINTKTNQSRPMVHDKTNLMNIRDENQLFTLYNRTNRDIGPMYNGDNSASNHLLYRIYHKNDTQLSCFPNQDCEYWNNQTKKLYQSVDLRNTNY